MHTSYVGGCSYLLYCFALFCTVFIVLAIALGYPMAKLSHLLDIPEIYAREISFALTFLIAIPTASVAHRLLRRLFVGRSASEADA